MNSEYYKENADAEYEREGNPKVPHTIQLDLGNVTTKPITFGFADTIRDIADYYSENGYLHPKQVTVVEKVINESIEHFKSCIAFELQFDAVTPDDL